MLTPEQEKFMRYWEEQRTRKKQFLRKFSIGLPLGAFLVAAVLFNLLSGWYQRAEMALRASSSSLLVILAGGIAIVVFITIFSAYYRWDQNEVNYQDLLRKKQAAEGGQDREPPLPSS